MEEIMKKTLIIALMLSTSGICMGSQGWPKSTISKEEAECRDECKYSQKESLITQNTKNTDGVIEFIYTDSEIKEIGKWNNKTIKDLVEDFRQGDPSDAAQKFFGCLASIGFAPALNQVAQHHIKDKPNPFLEFVYINLTISFGHTEFAEGYYDVRSVVIKELCPEVMKEIEKVADDKKSVILKNQSDYKINHDKMPFSDYPFSDYIVNITKEDHKYGNKNWLDLCKNDRSYHKD